MGNCCSSDSPASAQQPVVPTSQATAATASFLGPTDICNICRAIPFKQLPSEDEPGFSHQPSLLALRQSAKSCQLCRMILFGVNLNRDAITGENLYTDTGNWIESNSNDLGGGKVREEQILLGAYCPGSNIISKNVSARPPLQTSSNHAFEDDATVRPWLYGSWWRYGDEGPADLLIGLGVRVGRTAHIENGEGNTRSIRMEDGKLHDRVTFRGTHLRLRTKAGSPLATYIPGRLKALNSASPIAFDRLFGWIQACQSVHQCKPPNALNSPLPTRVLELEAASDVIRLIDSSGKSAPFIALSHCWGTTHRITLTKATIGMLKVGISAHELPQTFRDAVKITQALGLRYLWIDSLCIIQDDHEDWEIESAQMARVYASSFLTIAASGSEDDATGCFPSMETRMNQNLASLDGQSLGKSGVYANVAPFLVQQSEGGEVGIISSEGSSAILSFPNLGEDVSLSISAEWMPTSRKSKPRIYGIPHFGRPYDPIESQPLSTRGWVLQERILSPRTIHYGLDQMYWECTVCILAEDGSRSGASHYNVAKLIEGQRLPLEKHGLGSITSGISLIEGHPPLPGRPIGRWEGGWLGVVEDFTERHLTKSEDKLPALSGLANHLAAITGDIYYAGLWRSHILEDLSWRVYARAEQRAQVPGGFAHIYAEYKCTPCKPPAYRAPSWSWASLDAHIKFVHLDFSRIMTEFIDAHVTPAGKDSFGRVSSGCIKLRGPVKTTTEAPPSFKPSPLDPLGFGVLVQMEHSTGLSYGEAFFDLKPQLPCHALFLDPSNALLLEASEGEPGEYTRIGIAKFLRTEHQRKTEPMLGKNGSGFQKVPYGPITKEEVQEITIL